MLEAPDRTVEGGRGFRSGEQNWRQGGGQNSRCSLCPYYFLGSWLYFLIQSHFPDQETEAQRSEAENTPYFGMRLESGRVVV